LNLRLPRMRRMQRLRNDRLPGMKRVSAAMGRSVRSVVLRCGLWRPRWRKDGRKILHGAVPCQFHVRHKNFGVCGPDVPDRRRKQDDERLACHGRGKRNLGKTLVNPTVAKVAHAKKYLRRCRPTKQGHDAGGELFAPASPCNGKLRGMRLPSQVWPGTQAPPGLHVTGDAQVNHPMRIIPLRRSFQPGNAKEWLAVRRAICNDKPSIRTPC
jgi:hypothetical protein